MYPEGWAKLSALFVFVGFNLTFFPQFHSRLRRHARRYWQYPPEFQVLNVLSTAGASILAVGYLLPMIYLLWSLRYGPIAEANPWGAAGLEWQTTSPPPTFNFDETPIVTWEAYNYDEIPARNWRPRLHDSKATTSQLATQVATMEHEAHNPALLHHFADAQQQKNASLAWHVAVPGD